MTVVVSVLVVVVVLLSVLVAGLLRSHATILRRLHELGVGLDRDPGAPASPGIVPRADGRTPAPRADLAEGRRAADVAGVGPHGESVAVRVVDVAHDTVLVFLSTDCSACAAFWSELADPRLPAGARLVVVTRDPAEESPTEVAERTPSGVRVVMSTAAWTQLAVPGSPFVIHVDGPSGRVVGEGTAERWDRVRSLILRAGDDGTVASATEAPTSGWRKAAGDRAREQELDRLLLDAGIAPGDPSLYGEQQGGDV